MINLREIKAPVAKHMDEFDSRFRDVMKSSVPLLDKVVRYIMKSKGKQMRPLFVMLSAEVSGGVCESTYHGATLIELLHTATLVHDDVVDDSNLRRGFFSINALWKNKIAVLVGDYLLSRGLSLALNESEYDILRIVSDAVRDMSEGELLQIEKARYLNIDEAVYFEIIRKKTASLISSCCAAGAASATKDKVVIEKMKLFGECVGIAFQIKDDLFDFENNSASGKPGGLDIRERKISLPLIHLLKNVGYAERRRIINIVKNHNDDSVRVEEVLALVRNSGGIPYASEKMAEYRDKALAIMKGFPESSSRTALENLVIFTTERQY